jgi:hypothetical protein
VVEFRLLQEKVKKRGIDMNTTKIHDLKMKEGQTEYNNKLSKVQKPIIKMKNIQKLVQDREKSIIEETLLMSHIVI